MSHRTVRSHAPANCPECKLPKLEFVLRVDGVGAKCVDCHVRVTSSGRPFHEAAKSWASIGLHIRMLDTQKGRARK